MLEVVTGGSGSGKSEYAENLAVSSHCTNELIYIATMQAFDQESKNRIKRHREMRDGKGFSTIEHYENLQNICIPTGATVLLECMSNLLANEMYAPHRDPKEKLDEKVLAGVEQLLKCTKNLIIVTNEVFSDGINYEKESVEYIKCLGKINCELLQLADHVTEVVCGIPIKIK